MGLLVARGQFDVEDVGGLESKGLPEPTPGPAEALRDRRPERARQLAASAKDLAQRHGMPTVDADAHAVLSA